MRIFAALFLLLASLTAWAEPLILEGRFDKGSLDGWKTFTPKSEPKIEIVEPGVLKGQRSDHRGLVALSRWFGEPQTRLKIEFSFAVSAGSGRVFHTWSQEPEGRDASQLNLCVQGGTLQHYDGRSRTWEHVGGRIQASKDADDPVWHRLRAIVDAESGGVSLWLSEPGERELPDKPTATVAAYRTGLPLGGISFVSGTRISSKAWYLVDDLVVETADDVPAPGAPPEVRGTYQLWTGPHIMVDPAQVPFAEGIEHRVIHRPGKDDYKFLHGAAIIEHGGVFYANWASSPINENGPHETLRGRRSKDGGKTWSALEIIGPGFEGGERHSHGILFSHKGELWTICARWGAGGPGKKYSGLKGEAFVLNPKTDHWDSHGIVLENCWPYHEPALMGNGNYITGGQDKDGLPVAAISQGADLEKKWDAVFIPYPAKLAPIYAETSVWATGAKAIAVIRGGGNVAWVATSENSGRTWAKAQPSNLPMPRAKAIMGRLSTGQLYLISNFKTRDTLVISVGKPGELTVSKMFRLRHGRSAAPHYKGKGKFPQWSYPNSYEHDGNLYVVYSVGKEECGLTIVPVASLAPPPTQRRMSLEK